jgi:hypothetical protein
MQRHQQIDRQDARLMLAKRLANDAFYAITVNGSLENALWNCDREPSAAEFIFAKLDDQICSGKSCAVSEQTDNIVFNQPVLTAIRITSGSTSSLPCFTLTRRQFLPFAGDVLQNATSLYSDTCATLGTTGIDHPSAANGFHANSKAVGFFATGNRRLVGAFHDYSRLNDFYGENICRAVCRPSKNNSTLSCFFSCTSRGYD